jgi:hypothetical protein
MSGNDRDVGPISNRGIAIYAAILVLVLALGYFLLNKLVDISSEEDCALAHRRNCGATEQSR